MDGTCISIEFHNAIVREVVQRRQVGNTNTFLGANTRAKPNEDIDLNLEAKVAKVAMKPWKAHESIEIEDSVTEKNDNNQGPP